MVKHKDIRVTIYPIPAPKTAHLLYEVDSLDEIHQVCSKLTIEQEVATEYDDEQIYAHFHKLSSMISFTQHLEIKVEADGLEWEALLFDLSTLLPQFAWISCSMEPSVYGQRIYYFNFVPIVCHTTGFPFTVNLSDSLMQQLSCSAEEAMGRVYVEIEKNILDKGLLHVLQNKTKKQPIKKIQSIV